MDVKELLGMPFEYWLNLDLIAKENNIEKGVLELTKQLQNAKIRIKDLENCNNSLSQEGRSFLTTAQELEELTIVQEETIKIQTKDKIYLRAKIAEWKDRAKELDDACCKITGKNILLTKLLTKMYNEYKEDGRISKDVIYSVQSIFGE